MLGGGGFTQPPTLSSSGRSQTEVGGGLTLVSRGAYAPAHSVRCPLSEVCWLLSAIAGGLGTRHISNGVGVGHRGVGVQLVHIAGVGLVGHVVRAVLCSPSLFLARSRSRWAASLGLRQAASYYKSLKTVIFKRSA